VHGIRIDRPFRDPTSAIRVIMRKIPLILSIAVSCILYGTSVVAADDAIDFGKQIAPILTRNCSACHNAKKPEGGLVLESYSSLMKGGDSGDSVVAGMADKGELLARIVATDDSTMPPTDNSVGAKRLTESEVALIKASIAAGAMAPAETGDTAMNWRDITGSLKPIYASDMSPDGSYLSFGVGNVVAMVYEPFGATPPTIEYLLDPELKLVDGTPIKATHLDLVQSLAFSHDSQRLATGGYRSVKIWRRQTASSPLANPIPAGSRLVASNLEGTRLAFATSDNAIAIFDTTNLQQVTILRGHQEPITAATWSASMDCLFTCDKSGKALRWNLVGDIPSTLEFPRTDETEQAPRVTLVAEGITDARALASINDSNVLIVRADNKLVNLNLVPATESTATTETFSPNAAFDRFEGVNLIGVTKVAEGHQYLVAFGNVIELVAADSAVASKRIDQGEPVGAISASRDGSKLGAAGASGQIKLWNLQDGKQLATTQGDYDHLRSLRTAERNVARQKAFVDFLAARVPELKKEAEKEVEARKKVEEARAKAVELVAAKMKDVETAATVVTTTQASIEETRKAIEEANKRMATLMTELEAKQKAVADAEKNKKTAEEELAKHDQALATATDGVERANAEIPKQEQLVASETAILTSVQQSFEALQKTAPAPTSAIAFDASGTRIIVATEDNSINLFDVVSGKPVAKLQPATATLKTIVVAPDQQLLGGDNDQFAHWDLNLPWQLERSLGGPTSALFSDRITALDFSPDGKWLAVGSGPPSRFGDVKLFAIDSGEIHRDLGEAHSDTVLGLRFSPDGRHLATAGADKLCRLFELESGKLLRTFEGHTHHVLGVAWQNDGLTIATASADNSVKTWNVTTGERKQSIGGFTKEVTGIEFVGQTDQILTSSIDGQAKLHNAANGQQVRVFTGPNSALYTVAVTNDGQYVTVGGQSGEVWVWKVSDAKVVRKIPE
jgi:WD40 repeat protein